MIFDLSRSDLLGPESDALRAVLAVLPEALVIGSHARDIHTHGIAGLRRGAATRDMDVAIRVATAEDYRRATAHWTALRGTGQAFTVSGIQVDVIPYGPLAPGGLLTPAPGIVLDVTGLHEAAEHAITVHLADDLTARCPDLPGMVILKLFAWSIRQGATLKDAGDLALLLEASTHGHYEDLLFAEGADLAAMQFDPRRAGPHRTGRIGAGRLSPRDQERALAVLSDSGVEQIADATRRGGVQRHDLIEQLIALRDGIIAATARR